MLTLVCAIQYNTVRKDPTMNELEKKFENAVMEIRRGTLLLCVLSQLDKPHYGYELVQLLAEQGLDIDQNTLYPLLRRLEEQEVLTSDWSVDGNRPRKYYSISKEGMELFKRLSFEWNRISEIVKEMLN
jgi:PadR family transcriptional regulator PadR